MKNLLYTFLFLLTCGGAAAQNENACSIIVQNSEDFSVLENAVYNLDYYVYLNQPNWNVTTLLLTDKAFESFVDPVSSYYYSPQMWRFNIDKTKSLAQRLSIEAYNCEIDADGTPVPSGTARRLTGAKETHIKDRLQFILDNSIIMESYKEGRKYYQTRDYSFVCIEKNGGTYQISSPLFGKATATAVHNVDNGLVLVFDKAIVPNNNSVAQLLSLNPDFSEFLWVLENSGALSKFNFKDKWVAADQNYGNLLNIKAKGMIGAEDATTSTKVTYLLNNYHYTIYAPTNAAMTQAYADGLPDANAMVQAELLDEKEGKGGTRESHVDSLKEVLLDFVKYHIQEDAVFIDNGFISKYYDSGKTKFVKSNSIDEETGQNVWDGTYSPGQPYKLKVNVSPSGLTVTDNMGNTRNVIMSEGTYNLMAREYWVDGTSVSTIPTNTTLNNSSFVVIHAIDGPLYYDAPKQFKYEYKPVVTDNY